MTQITWDVESEWNANQDASGVTNDGLGGHTGRDTLDHGYEYGSLTQGLVAYYPFDGTVNDATPLGNDGNDQTSAGYNGSGQVGSDSKDFDGTDDEVQPPDLGLDKSTSFTIGGWANLDDTNNDHPLFARYDGSNSLLQVYWDTSISDWNVGMGDNSANKHDIQAGSATADTWTHIILTFDSGSETSRLYQDGSEIGSDSSSIDDFGSSNGPYIGARNDGGFYMDGQIDDFRVYDRVLSQQEISALSNLTSTQTVVEADVL